MNLRLLGLAGVVVCAVALPLAVASAGQVGDKDRAAASAPDGHPRAGTSANESTDGSVSDPAARAGGQGAPGDAKPTARSSPTSLLLGLGLATATRCGPELTAPEGIEAQTCVLTQGDESWARTYYRNATGDALDAVLSLMGPDDHTVRTSCAVGAGDDPGTCETPREHSRGGLDAYTAVSEFTTRGGRGPLLLRSGSNSGSATGS
ncbi:hypothetical protein [Streptomyces sp. NPDC087294]|uniref:hypothetical protein n=1 Tax=Streptomyces sp. NPDC087294 TaxID=3365777 RepID=UPI0038001628